MTRRPEPKAPKAPKELNLSELTELGEFEDLEIIGRGGMGTVYKARQASLDRVIAVKILSPAVAIKDPIFVERFLREARWSARLSHPHVVHGISAGKDEKTGLYYFAMEYIDGPSVGKILKEQEVLDEDEALRIALAVAEALICAHKAGIVHRDIKPENILLTSVGEPKLADLGIARRISDPSDETKGADTTAATPVDPSITHTRVSIGTPNYMAPEQVRGESTIDIRADLYALGATMFQMVSGEAPFKGASARDVKKARLIRPAPDVRTVNSNVSEETAAMITRLMRRDPANRFQSPAELVMELKRLLAGRSERATEKRESDDRAAERKKIDRRRRASLRMKMARNR